MKIKEQIQKILILFIGIVLIYNIKGYCTVNGTKRMEITGGDPWVSIGITKAYEECESLNSTTSTLGTNNLRAHLTTDADWSAMAIFSVSQYGDAKSNTPTTTTGNESGIYNIGRKWSFSTGLSNKNSSSYSSLYNADGSLKRYMREFSKERTENDFVGFKNFSEGGTFGYFNSSHNWVVGSRQNAFSFKIGLFGVVFGWDGYPRSSGGGDSSVSFRPVIWN